MEKKSKSRLRLGGMCEEIPFHSWLPFYTVLILLQHLLRLNHLFIDFCFLFTWWQNEMKKQHNRKSHPKRSHCDSFSVAAKIIIVNFWKINRNKQFFAIFFSLFSPPLAFICKTKDENELVWSHKILPILSPIVPLILITFFFFSSSLCCLLLGEKSFFFLFAFFCNVSAVFLNTVLGNSLMFSSRSCCGRLMRFKALVGTQSTNSASCCFWLNAVFKTNPKLKSF